MIGETKQEAGIWDMKTSSSRQHASAQHEWAGYCLLLDNPQVDSSGVCGFLFKETWHFITSTFRP